MRTRFIAGFLLPFIVTGACMWAFDPFYMFSTLNTSRKPFNPRERASLALEAVRMRPEAAFIGTSRTRRLDPAHSGWKNMKVLNAGVSGARMYEMADYFEHIQSVQPLHTAVVEVSFWPLYAEARETDDAYDARLLRPGDHGLQSRARYVFQRMLDRYEGLYSLRGIMQMRQIKEPMRPLTEWIASILQGYPAADSMKAPVPARHPPTEVSTIDSLRRIVTLADAHGTSLIFFIAPMHAEHFQEDIVENRWSRYEEHLRAITDYLDGGNELGKSFPLWNFQRYNDLTQLSPPPVTITDSQWYDNREHFSPKTGTMILDTLLGVCDEPCTTPPEDFAILLNRGTIDAHIAHLRAHRPTLQADVR